MPPIIELGVLIGLCIAMVVSCLPFGADDASGFVALPRWLWRRARETDAEKAARLLTKSQRLLDEARALVATSQHVEKQVSDEFERRLRIVAGGDGGTA